MLELVIKLMFMLKKLELELMSSRPDSFIPSKLVWLNFIWIFLTVYFIGNFFPMDMNLCLFIYDEFQFFFGFLYQVIDRSFGFDTAVEEAQRAINAAHVEAESAENGIGVVKLMGRYSGKMISLPLKQERCALYFPLA